MSSTNKTTNLNLNKWIATDKPKMADFVNDNELIDAAITSHSQNTTLHLTTSDRDKLENPVMCYMIAGDGNALKEYTFTFTPKLVICYCQSKPFCSYDATNNYNVYSAGISYTGNSGSTPGVFLTGTKVKLSQTQGTPEDGIFLNLNQLGETYTIIAFK